MKATNHKTHSQNHRCICTYGSMGGYFLVAITQRQTPSVKPKKCTSAGLVPMGNATALVPPQHITKLDAVGDLSTKRSSIALASAQGKGKGHV